jgi:L-rhamnose mutarotase
MSFMACSEQAWIRRGKNMTRKAFAMHLHPGCEKEYKKRHDEIWPELKAELFDESPVSDSLKELFHMD